MKKYIHFHKLRHPRERGRLEVESIFDHAGGATSAGVDSAPDRGRSGGLVGDVALDHYSGDPHALDLPPRRVATGRGLSPVGARSGATVELARLSLTGFLRNFTPSLSIHFTNEWVNSR